MAEVTLFLMTQKGFAVLENLIKLGYTGHIAAVVVGRDTAVEEDYSQDLIAICERHNISWYERKDYDAIHTPYALAVSWRWLIDYGSKQLMVLHDGLLPRYRGFAPLVSALLNNEPEVGVTALIATQQYDAGDIIAQKAVRVAYPIKIADAIQLLEPLYVELAIYIFNMIKSGIPVIGTAQDGEAASYSLWRDEQDYTINWHSSAEAILQFIYTVSAPYKGAKTYILGSEPIRIYDAAIVPDVQIANRDVGKVIFMDGEFPIVVCGTGLLKITQAAYENSRADVLPLKHFRIRFM